MMFRVVFNTAFIRSNILMLNRDEVDILWDAKDLFPEEFRAEILFSEMDAAAAASIVVADVSCFEEKEGLPVEAFAKVHEIFSNVDWLDHRTDFAFNVLQQISASNIIQEKSDTDSSPTMGIGSLLRDTSPKDHQDKKHTEGDDKTKSSLSLAIKTHIVPSPNMSQDTDEYKGKEKPCVSWNAVQLPSQPCVISRKTPETSQTTSPICNSAKDSSLLVSGHHDPSLAPINKPLLHDHASSVCPVATHHITAFPTVSDPTPAAVSCKPESLEVKSDSISPPTPTPPPPTRPSLTSSTSMVTPPPQLPSHHLSSSKPTHFSFTKQSESYLQERDKLSLISSLPAPEASSSGTTSSTSLSATSFPAFAFASSTVSKPPAPPPTPPLKTPVSDRIDVSFSTPSRPISTVASSMTPSTPTSPSPPTIATPPFPLLGEKSDVKVGPPPPPPPPCSRQSVISTTSSKTPPPAPPPPTTPTPPPPPLPPLKQKSAIRGEPPPPPPPPLCSGPSASSTVTSPSPPPAPPPPILSSNSSPAPPPPPPPPTLSSNSSPIPSAPPPPLPFSKGVSKTGIASSVSDGGSPVLAPLLTSPSGAKGRLSRTINSRSHQTKKLKPLHWLKLTRAVQGSMWAEAQKTGEASKAPEIDIKELENLFAAAVPNSDHGGKSSQRGPRGPKVDKVQLIDHRRAYNCEIMLSKVKVPMHELMSSVLDLEESALDADQVENLIKFCPTKEEMEQLKGYTGDKEKLGKCEQFFMELMKVPRVESKLRVFSFKMQFRSQVSDLRNSLNVVNSAAEQVRNSAKLRRIMQTILSLGNALNQGTARGSAIGFRLDSLLKFTDTRARNNKMTLMHYLCKVLADKLPKLLDFSKHLVNLEPASKIQLKFLAEEMQALSKGLEKIVQELSMAENDGPISENFLKTLKEFLRFAEAEVRTLASLYSGVGRNVDALILYFGEDPSRCPFEQVISTLLNFMRMFNKAHNENSKQLDQEKKKRAQIEKSKTNASRKDSERLIHTTIQSGNVN